MVLRTGTNVPLEPLFLPIGTKRSTTLGSYFSRDNQMGRMPPSLVVSENVMRKSEKVTHSICYLLLVADLQGLLLLIRSEMHPLRYCVMLFMVMFICWWFSDMALVFLSQK